VLHNITEDALSPQPDSSERPGPAFH
jgi:hypothetical protein